MHQDYSQGNCYQKSLFVMKQNISRIIALVLFLCASISVFKLLIGIVDRFFVFNFNGMFLTKGSYLVHLFFVFTIVAGMMALLLPLFLGIKRWFFMLGAAEDKSLKTIFHYFTWYRYKKALKFQLYLRIRQLANYIICLAPSLIMRFLVPFHAFGDIASAILLIIVGVLSIVGLLSGFYVNLRYFMAPYLFFCRPELPYKKLFAQSHAIMKLQRNEIISLYVSMCPFYMLCLLVLPILFIFPYIRLLLAEKGRLFLAEEEYYNSREILFFL